MSEPNAIASTNDFEFAALSEAKNYRAAIIKEFEAYLRDDVLEIGAGIGQISEAMLELPRVTSLTALEPETNFHDAFQKRLPNTVLIKGTVADLPQGTAYNAAIMVNVLEHIENDTEELMAIQKILKEKSGHLCILVPARQEIFSKLDSHFGHYRRYNKPNLKTKLTQAGFEIVKLHYFNMVGYFAWALRYKLMQGMDFDINQVRLFDRVIFPIGHWLESKLLRPPIGQSLIAIAKAK
jgi:SAM-dependent methyltransferase